uniref:SRPBCC domain-containing protein n=1 Tax=Psilocybe cubensis TaxID=181762 RepID=A0A8H7XL02_PSICU
MTILIDAPIEKVWDILMDFPEYKNWNTFARSMVLVDYNTRQPLADQTLELGKYIDIRAHMNPGDVPEEPGYLDKGNAFVFISTLEPDIHRVAWTTSMFPSWILQSVRTQALSVDEASGKTKYENREVFSGFLSYIVKFFVGGKLNKGFAAAASSLKKHAEKK